MLYKYQVDAIFGSFKDHDIDDSNTIGVQEFCSFYR